MPNAQWGRGDEIRQKTLFQGSKLDVGCSALAVGRSFLLRLASRRPLYGSEHQFRLGQAARGLCGEQGALEKRPGGAAFPCLMEKPAQLITADIGEHYADASGRPARQGGGWIQLTGHGGMRGESGLEQLGYGRRRPGLARPFGDDGAKIVRPLPHRGELAHLSRFVTVQFGGFLEPAQGSHRHRQADQHGQGGGHANGR